MNKIVLTGLRDLPTDDYLEPQTDYGIFLVAQRISEEKMDDEEDCFKYRLKMLYVDSLVDLKTSKELKFEKGNSPSQKQRFRISQNLGEDCYDGMMAYLMSRMDELCEDYKENTNKLSTDEIV